jgi:hypothetical protein
MVLVIFSPVSSRACLSVGDGTPCAFMCLSRIVRCSNFKWCIGMQKFAVERTICCCVFDLHSLTTKDEPISVTPRRERSEAEFGPGRPRVTASSSPS